jgi:hypothetical protein
LEHYVLVHNIALPEEFISHMEKFNWVPKPIEFNPNNGGVIHFLVDDTFWVEWCKKNRNPILVSEKNKQLETQWKDNYIRKRAKMS